MIITKKMITSILENHLSNDDIYQRDRLQCEFDELVEGITDELNLIVDTELRLENIKDEEQILFDAHDKAFAKLQEKRDEVIKQCPHYSTTDNICDTCGKEMQHDG